MWCIMGTSSTFVLQVSLAFEHSFLCVTYDLDNMAAILRYKQGMHMFKHKRILHLEGSLV